MSRNRDFCWRWLCDKSLQCFCLRSALHLFPFKVNDGTAAGIYALRRLKFKRCGELALRLSSRLTFAWVGVAILAIHSSRCITAGLLVYFIQARNISVVFRAIHLTVNMPIQICVAIPLLPGAAKMRVPARGTIPTSICGRVSTAR